ncbi:hypothetical protein DAI22_12g159832 [Oryza sativa Japonica Group]|nr:hypothetical protein DAI22_12g159832 [Oryza sativa Japonica Group]
MLLLSDCVCAIVLSKTKSNSKPKRSNNHGVGLDNEEPEAAQPTTMEENTMAAPVIARRGAQMCCHHNTVTAKGEWEKALELVDGKKHTCTDVWPRNRWCRQSSSSFEPLTNRSTQFLIRPYNTKICSHPSTNC